MPEMSPPPEEDWYRVQAEELMCPKCGEVRLVDEVVDFRGTQAFCKVCSFAWWIVGKQRNWRD